MKIVDLNIHVLSAPLAEPFAFSQGYAVNRTTMIVEILTDEGIIGWGESLCHGLQPPQIAASIVEFALKPILIGEDPSDVEVLWDKMYNLTRPYGQAGATVNAISAVDIALWDILGKSHDKPTYQLLGGAYRKAVKPYATGFYRIKGKQYPETAIEEAHRHLENGFDAMKLKTGFGMKEDIDYILSVREAIGPNVLLMADANCAFNAATARRVLYEIEPAKLHWFEEPLPPEDIEGYKQLIGLTSTFIAAGENIFGSIGARNWIAEKALDVIQPDLASSGGFTACKRINALASSWNMMVNPHVWGTGIGLAASLQYIANIPPAPLCLKPIEPMLEYDQSSHPFRQDLIYGSISMKNGMVDIPSAPGLGIEVNRDVIERYKIN
ncbi:mandelate racemase/muconate lactonizing enzyme family protein [Bacillus sp. Marseille-P3661]|uniref:mandelate racemase/muconate lactonizing enzyme family protein n=1 Tax=Bacillus sp. Marseille-P3661 TaxID=1936234 RepID=UPI000C8648A7|nr:mandelate racemase/muconate lactonizing enzyme family protein [Bacillus sp. Marseille-P3661]